MSLDTELKIVYSRRRGRWRLLLLSLSSQRWTSIRTDLLILRCRFDPPFLWLHYPCDPPYLEAQVFETPSVRNGWHNCFRNNCCCQTGVRCWLVDFLGRRSWLGVSPCNAIVLLNKPIADLQGNPSESGLSWSQEPCCDPPPDSLALYGEIASSAMNYSWKSQSRSRRCLGFVSRLLCLPGGVSDCEKRRRK